MAEGNIILSEKHGLNPSLVICPLCNKEQGIALLGRIKGDKEAPKISYSEPCQECMEDIVKNDRVLVVGVRDDKNVIGFAVVNREAFGDSLPEGEHVALMKEKDFKEMYNLINSNKNDDNNI